MHDAFQGQPGQRGLPGPPGPPGIDVSIDVTLHVHSTLDMSRLNVVRVSNSSCLTVSSAALLFRQQKNFSPEWRSLFNNSFEKKK